jgi:membrane peptidoglycan carboxypeptidase
VLALLYVFLAVSLIAGEMRSSWLQSSLLTFADKKLHYTLAAGPSHAIAYPRAGPYDRRLGYALLPTLSAVWSRPVTRWKRKLWIRRPTSWLGGSDYFPLTRRKARQESKSSIAAGNSLNQSDYPKRVYPNFASIPPLVVETLSFIENRHIMDPNQPYRNPAIEWPRASPGETFFTAGGMRSFGNFETARNSQVLSVREAFEKSVNLVFIRLMRDIEGYYVYRVERASPTLLSDPNDPGRRHYLERFADEEGKLFLSRFYQQSKGQSADQSLDSLVRSVRATPLGVAVIFRSVRPEAGFDAFQAFLKAHVPRAMLQDQEFSRLYEKCGPDKFNLSDRGYLSRVHPLQLWLLNYREQHPQATLSQILAGSAAQRQEVYSWLFRTGGQHAQDRRIRILLEEDAFHEIWQAWKQLGYPFDSLLPSYATSIGSSGDTPQALAELAGIIINRGERRPYVSIRRMDFGAGTPVETVLTRQPAAPQQVLSGEVAALARQEMLGIVRNGTGRRALNSFVLPDGTVLPVGGKMGTGNNRFRVFGPGGGILNQRAVNRTATFAFIIGDRFFGTVTAFVPAAQASRYGFTSALAVRLVKELAPQLTSLMAG